MGEQTGCGNKINNTQSKVSFSSGIVQCKRCPLAAGLAALLAIVNIVIIVRYAITFRAGDMAITMVMLASAIASDVVCLLATSATRLVACLQLVLEFG